MEKMILTDVDETLLNWSGGFKAFASKKLNRPIRGQSGDWDMSGWLGTTKAEAEAMVTEFNEGDFLFGTLKPLPHAKAAVKTLADKGYSFVAITSCSPSPITHALRKANLYNVFGDVFTEVVCLALGESKLPHLKRFGPAHWVEDKFSNAIHGLEAGHTSYMIRAHHNLKFEAEKAPLNWVNDWREIIPKVEGVA